MQKACTTPHGCFAWKVCQDQTAGRGAHYARMGTQCAGSLHHRGLLGKFLLVFIRPYAYRWKPCYGLKGYGVCMPCDFEVHGVDMSHYQGHIDWPRLAEHRAGEFPIRFIFMKATEGGDHQDDTFRQNFDSAKTYRFIRGAYHYFLPRTDALKQADFFIRTVPLTAGDLPPVLDVETTGKKDKAELQACVKTWLDRVEAHYGVKPILYTSYKFKMRYLDSPVFDAYPYWIAHYYVDSVRYQGPWHFGSIRMWVLYLALRKRWT